MALWTKFSCLRSDVGLDFVLAGGQSFRWTKNASGEWVGVIQRQVWKFKQNDDCIEYQVFPQPHPEQLKSPEEHKGLPALPPKKRRKLDDTSWDGDVEVPSTLIAADHNAALRGYLGLEPTLKQLYETWSSADARFAAVAPSFTGIRVLQQDFIENVFSFICSSNNNIQRIQQMVEKLCVRYGKEICEVDGKIFYSFPDVTRLAKDSVEKELREMSFGYRARFISKAAKFITESPSWISEVKAADYPTAKELLMRLPGVGAKVADCICLMSLGHHQAVPVDTHVFAVTVQHYLPHLKQVKSVTNRVYNEIADFYRERFGPMAGWAHSVLFTADLRQFKRSTEKPDKKSTTRKRKTPSGM